MGLKGIEPGLEKIAELTSKKSGLSVDKVKGMKKKSNMKSPSFSKRRPKLFGNSSEDM